MRNKLYIIFGILSCCFIGCSVSPQKHRETKMLMGTIVHIDVCRSDADAPETKLAYEEAWKRISDISWRMYGGNEGSDVAKINESNGNEVSVGQDTYDLLRSARKYYRVTNGAFDVTVRPLIELWKHGGESNVTPTEDQITLAGAAIGMQNVQLLDNGQIKLSNVDTSIDLGGIAKGYAIDETARIFREHGLKNFYIDAGGDIYVGGVNCQGEAWRVGIRDPKNLARVYDIVEVKNKAVATSGNYEQYYEINGKRWSHIINPKTGYPQEDVVSATVIAPSAKEADAMATALCVKGPQKGTDMIDNYNTDYASIILTKNEEHKIQESLSRTYEKYRSKR